MGGFQEPGFFRTADSVGSANVGCVGSANVGCRFVLMHKDVLHEFGENHNTQWSDCNLGDKRSVNGPAIKVIKNTYTAIMSRVGAVESTGAHCTLDSTRQECTQWTHLEDGPDAEPAAWLIVRAAMFGRHIFAVNKALKKCPVVSLELSCDLFHGSYVHGQTKVLLTTDGYGEIPAVSDLYVFFVAVMRRWVTRHTKTNEARQHAPSYTGHPAP